MEAPSQMAYGALIKFPSIQAVEACFLSLETRSTTSLTYFARTRAKTTESLPRPRCGLGFCMAKVRLLFFPIEIAYFLKINCHLMHCMLYSIQSTVTGYICGYGLVKPKSKIQFNLATDGRLSGALVISTDAPWKRPLGQWQASLPGKGGLLRSAGDAKPRPPIDGSCL